MKSRMFGVCVVIGFTSAAAVASDEIRLGQTVSDEVVAGFGRVCPALGLGGAIEASSYWRAFDLSDFDVTQDFAVTRVEFGIETLRLPTLLEVDFKINIYGAVEGTTPQTGLPIIGTAVMSLTDRSVEVVSVDVSALAAAGSAIIVEVSAPSLRDLAGGDVGNIFIPGANGDGESEPVYFASDACGVPEPVAWDPADGVFNYVLTVYGDPFCATDLDGDGLLTVFDFLEFSNLFDAGDLRADFDGDGVLTLFDFLEFQNRFMLGC